MLSKYGGYYISEGQGMIKLHEFSDVPNQTLVSLNVAVKAAHKAGEIIREGYYQTHLIKEKSHGDLVSVIDTNADHAVHEAIRATYPNDIIFSEELAPNAKPVDRYWIVDPLDGTSSYLFRVASDMPSVMIALCDTFGALVSVVYFPLSDELFYAIRGEGAFERLRSLRCEVYDLSQAWIDLNQYSDDKYESDAVRTLKVKLRGIGGARLVTSSPPHSGLSLRITAGDKRLAGVVHDNGAKQLKQGPWDVIPIRLIFEEAGGFVCNMKGKPYDPYSPEPFMMMGSKALAEEVLGLLER
jgi:fructose-1,6-bisphosphatase/inositol monophosphatase family enzyme